MKNYEPTRKVVRKSGNHFMTAAIQPQMIAEKSEFEARSYFIYGNPAKQEKATVLEIANKWGAGVNFNLLKVGEKRNSNISFELGLDEVEILIEYLQSIKPELKNYAGEVIEMI